MKPNNPSTKNNPRSEDLPTAEEVTSHDNALIKQFCDNLKIPKLTTLFATQVTHNAKHSHIYSAHTAKNTAAAHGPAISFDYGAIRRSAIYAKGNTALNITISEQKKIQDCADKLEQFCAKKYSLSSLPAEQQKESQVMLSVSRLILERRAALKILSDDTSSSNIQDLIMRVTSTRFKQDCCKRLNESRYFELTKNDAVIKENIKKHITEWAAPQLKWEEVRYENLISEYEQFTISKENMSETRPAGALNGAAATSGNKLEENLAAGTAGRSSTTSQPSAKHGGDTASSLKNTFTGGNFSFFEVAESTKAPTENNKLQGKARQNTTRGCVIS
jgi:hypothetical protein